MTICNANQPPSKLRKYMAALWPPCKSDTVLDQLEELSFRCSSLKITDGDRRFRHSTEYLEDNLRGDSEAMMYESDAGSRDCEESFPADSEGKSDYKTRIVVVGNRANHAKDLVDVLTSGGGYAACTTKAGLRVLASTETSPGRVFLDTTPLEHVNGRSITAVAKRWISQNSLRRGIVGRSVIIICVIPYATLEGDCFCKRIDDRLCWLDALRLTFREYKEGVLFLVNNCPQEISKRKTAEIEAIVQCHKFHSKNIVYCKESDDVKAILERSITWTSDDFAKISRGRRTKKIFATGPEKSICVKPSLVKEVRSSETKYEIWGPDRVLLFGRTGSGKSTLAQMLTVGKVDPDSIVFSVRSGIRGCTKDIERGEGRGWYVVDTPGFGEPDCQESTVSNDYVCQMVKKFIAVIEGTFTHYLFLLQKGPVDQLDVKLWRFFKLLFGDDLSSHFSIVVSNADTTWLAENEEHLGQQFSGCSSFLCADFPRKEIDEERTDIDDELEAENEAVRASSLRELEEQLDRLRRCDRPCSYGKKSKMTKVIERQRRNLDS